MSQIKQKTAGKPRILITAGPTWVPVDKVRVLTNIFSGRLGYLIAQKAASKEDARVTLFLGPGRISLPEKQDKNLEIVRYKYFDELYDLIKKAVSSKKYDILIHSAAVADYAPEPADTKIKSGKHNLIITLNPTVKIVDQVKKWDPDIFLVKFKLEAGISPEELINIAFESMMKSKADLMVANEFAETSEKYHRAYIINPKKEVKKVVGKENIAKQLLNELNTIWKKK